MINIVKNKVVRMSLKKNFPFISAKSMVGLVLIELLISACAPPPRNVVEPESRREVCTGKIAVLRADSTMIRYRHDLALMDEMNQKASDYCSAKNKSANIGRQACEYSCCITAFQCR